MKAVVAAFNQEKALVGAFSVITNLRMDLFQALLDTEHLRRHQPDTLMSPARSCYQTFHLEKVRHKYVIKMLHLQ